MAPRTAYGNSRSENGWPMVDQGSCEWVTVPGTSPPVRLQLATGPPAVIMRAYAADVNAHVEKLRDADSAGWTATNSVGTSNHLSGTAMDLDWDSHPFRVSYAGFTPDMTAAMRDILAFYEGVMFWGQDWDNPKDSMHHQMGYQTYNNPKTADFIRRKIRADGFSTYKRDATAVAAVAAMTEKVLPYDKNVVAQERGWDCCPASVQVLLNSKGIIKTEDELIRAIGTNESGTNTVEQALPILNQLLPDAKFVAQWMPNDPPRPDQVEALWHNVKNSIDSGYPCVLNFEVPHSNFPRGTRGSETPAYAGSKIWHYVCAAGWADDGPGGRHLWIADPGFRPFGYWMSLEQAATAIPPHAYAYASVAAPSPKVVVPEKQQPTAVLASRPTSGYKSISPYRTPGEAAIGGLEVFAISDDSMMHCRFVEESAIQLGDQESIARLVRSAAGHGAETAPAFIKRARRALSLVPREDLAAVLQRVAIINPDWIDALRS